MLVTDAEPRFYGYTMEYDLQWHFRESRLGTIGAGTSEIQRNIIAKSMGL